MIGWAVSELGRKDNHVFSRPLGLTETGFVWDGRFNGTADFLLVATALLLLARAAA